MNIAQIAPRPFPLPVPVWIFLQSHTAYFFAPIFLSGTWPVPSSLSFSDSIAQDSERPLTTFQLTDLSHKWDTEAVFGPLTETRSHSPLGYPGCLSSREEAGFRKLFDHYPRNPTVRALKPPKTALQTLPALLQDFVLVPFESMLPGLEHSPEHTYDLPRVLEPERPEDSIFIPSPIRGEDLSVMTQMLDNPHLGIPGRSGIIHRLNIPELNPIIRIDKAHFLNEAPNHAQAFSPLQRLVLSTDPYFADLRKWVHRTLGFEMGISIPDSRFEKYRNASLEDWLKSSHVVWRGTINGFGFRTQNNMGEMNAPTFFGPSATINFGGKTTILNTLLYGDHSKQNHAACGWGTRLCLNPLHWYGGAARPSRLRAYLDLLIRYGVTSKEKLESEGILDFI